MLTPVSQQRLIIQKYRAVIAKWQHYCLAIHDTVIRHHLLWNCSQVNAVFIAAKIRKRITSGIELGNPALIHLEKVRGIAACVTNFS